MNICHTICNVLSITIYCQTKSTHRRRRSYPNVFVFCSRRPSFRSRKVRHPFSRDRRVCRLLSRGRKVRHLCRRDRPVGRFSWNVRRLSFWRTYLYLCFFFSIRLPSRRTRLRFGFCSNRVCHLFCRLCVSCRVYFCACWFRRPASGRCVRRRRGLLCRGAARRRRSTAGRASAGRAAGPRARPGGRLAARNPVWRWGS